MSTPAVVPNATAQAPWADALRDRYLAGEAIVFILHGNVFDLYPVGAQFVSLGKAVEGLLGATKSKIFELSLAQGVRVVKTDAPASGLAGLQDKGLAGALEFLEAQLRGSAHTAVVVPYAETLFPAAETHFLSFDERAAVTTLHRWSLEDALAKNDSIVVLIAESLSALSPALLTNPRIAVLELELPDAAQRTEAVRHFAPAMSAAQVARVAEHTSGLRLVQIANIVADPEGGHGLGETERRNFIGSLLAGAPDAESRAEAFARVTAGMTKRAIRGLIAPESAVAEDLDAGILKLVRQRKRELLEKECAGLVEFIDPKIGLDAVGGNEGIKAELMRVARTLREGDARRAPMGLLAVGPMGSGKTFVINAFLKEAGLNGIMLKNFRSKWVGSTESNLERVLAMVKVMGPIAVVIDEGDRSFGSRSEDNDGGTSSRVIARLKEFMSDTENRGKVLFILMTNRPDKLDIDIKRPGRLDLKLPFFYAQSSEERMGIVKAQMRRHQINWSGTDDECRAACAQLINYSNADLEAVVLMAAASSTSETPEVSGPALQAAADDFLPPQDHNMVRYMELLAAMECSRRSWLPDNLRHKTPEALRGELNLLQQSIR